MKFEKISEKQFNIDRVFPEMEYSDIKLPKRATTHSAGYDFFSPISFELKPGQSINIPTGIKMDIDSDKFLMIVPRSGLGFKYRVSLFNTVGIIDSDYYNNIKNEGHIWVKLYNGYPNHPKEGIMTINKGDAICQGIILPYFKVSDDDSDGVREGGFGSTNK